MYLVFGLIVSIITNVDIYKVSYKQKRCISNTYLIGHYFAKLKNKSRIKGGFFCVKILSLIINL